MRDIAIKLIAGLPDLKAPQRDMFADGGADAVAISLSPGSHRYLCGAALICYDVSADSQSVRVTDFSVPSRLRRQGHGKQAAKAFFDHLENHGRTVSLSPEPTRSGGAGKRRVHDFCVLDLGFDTRVDADGCIQRSPINGIELIEVDGTPRSTCNAKGARIAVAAEDIVAFWRWFGDSSAVDRHGRPLPVYHGTHSEFLQFSKTRDIGFHFGSSAQANKMSRKESGRLLESYLTISSPLIIKADPRAWMSDYVINTVLADVLDSDVRKSLTELSEVNLADARKVTADIAKSRGKEVPDAEWTNILGDYNALTLSSVKDELRNLGYDGIKYPNKYEGKGYSWVAFADCQVKSATAGFIGFAKAPESLARQAQLFLTKAVTHEVPDPRYASKKVGLEP